MGTTLSSLRVAVDADTGAYVSAMSAKVSADQAASKSSADLAASIDSTSARLNDGGAAMTRLTAQYVPGARAAQQFQQAVQQLGSQLDRGNLPLNAVQGLLQAVYTKYGYTADAAALASKGQSALADAATTLNARFASQTTATTAAAAGLDLIGGKLNIAKVSSSAMAEVMATMQRQVLALATGMGPMGVILSSLGPEGLAAAAAIGAAAAGFQLLSAGADDLAHKAVALQTFATATGISTDEIQALDQAGAAFGVTSDTVAKGMQNFAASVGQAQQGSGELFSSLLRINPQLAIEVSAAKSVGQAWDIVAQAYQAAANAGNAAGAASIGRAALGRGGAASAPALLGGTAQGGGLYQFGVDAAAASGTISNSLIPQLAALNAQLDEAKTKSTNTFESLFSQQVLTAELEFYQGLEKIATKLAEIQQNNSATATTGKAVGVGLLSAIPGVGPLAGLIASQFTTAPSKGVSAQDDQGALGVSVAGLAGLGGGEASLTATSAALYAVQQKLIGALAGTATPAQQLQLQLLGLKRAVDDHTLSADQAAHAQSLLVESFNVTQLQANVSAMGALASPTQQYAAAVAQLTLQANEGKIGQFALAAGVLAAKQAMDASVESIKEQYGIASQADIASAAYTKLNDDMAKIGATSAQSALAVAVVNKQIQNTADAMKVAGSATPQFTQLILDLQNANKTKDELLTSSGNALLQAAPAFVQALQQGQTIAQAISSSLTGAANSIANAFATAGAKSLTSGIMTGSLSSIGSGLTDFGLGTAISLVTGSLAQSQQAQQQWQQAQQNWAGMADQIAEFVCAMMSAEAVQEATGPNGPVVEKRIGKDAKSAKVIDLAGERNERHQFRRAA